MGKSGGEKSRVHGALTAGGCAFGAVGFVILFLATFFVLSVLFAKFTTGGGWDWSETDIEQTRQRGTVLVAALESYRSDHGTFPGKLDALVPRYLPAIPPPAVDAPGWSYWPSKREPGFTLGVWESETYDDHLTYSYAYKEWWYDNGGF